MKKNGINENGLLIIIVVLTAVLAGIGKLMSFGWITHLFCYIPIIPLWFILFVIAGITFARTNKKTIKDYFLFTGLCITIIISTFTFIDFADEGSVNMLFASFNADIFEYISVITFILNIVLAFYILYMSGKRKYVYEG